MRSSQTGLRRWLGLLGARWTGRAWLRKAPGLQRTEGQAVSWRVAQTQRALGRLAGWKVCWKGRRPRGAGRWQRASARGCTAASSHRPRPWLVGPSSSAPASRPGGIAARRQRVRQGSRAQRRKRRRTALRLRRGRIVHTQIRTLRVAVVWSCRPWQGLQAWRPIWHCRQRRLQRGQPLTRRARTRLGMNLAARAQRRLLPAGLLRGVVLGSAAGARRSGRL